MVVDKGQILLNSDPILYHNFFLKEDFEEIYNIVNAAIEDGNLKKNKYKNFIVKNNGMHVLLFSDNPIGPKFLNNSSAMFDLLIRLQDRISNIFQKEAVEISGYFARYSKESGSFPCLLPHIDHAKLGENYKMSLTSKLKSTFDWDIIVEDTRNKLMENDALFFSANLKTHWRPRLNSINDWDFYDIVVLHFNFKDMVKIPIDEAYFEKSNKILQNKELQKLYYDTI